MSSQIELSLRKRTLKCYIWSTLLYGAETWTLSQSLKNKIEAFEMWCYRRMLKISYTEHVSNDVVLIFAGAKRTLLKLCLKRKLEYFGHFVREGVCQQMYVWVKQEGRGREGAKNTVEQRCTEVCRCQLGRKFDTVGKEQDSMAQHSRPPSELGKALRLID